MTLALEMRFNTRIKFTLVYRIRLFQILTQSFSVGILPTPKKKRKDLCLILGAFPTMMEFLLFTPHTNLSIDRSFYGCSNPTNCRREGKGRGGKRREGKGRGWKYAKKGSSPN